MQSDYLVSLRDKLRVFARERDWEKFHTPRNLTAAISVEAAELLEHFQWATDPTERPSEGDLKEMAEEIADVLIYLVRLADVLSVDMIVATESKLSQNALKYPVALSKGKSDKYTRLS